MNPITTSKAIEARLRNYIRKSLPVERSLPRFEQPIKQLFDANPLMQDPYLELVPPYERGDSLQRLADDRVIHTETAQIFANYFAGGEGADPAAFHLHNHQSEAIRSVCAKEMNLVVCSGTGSGKTEAFLIPLVNHLVGEWIAAQKPDNWNAPGVRALILYPMNALVNDQVRRLRGVLRYAPYITFGKYIGEIKDNDSLRANLMDNLVAHEQAVDGVADLENYHGNGFDNETRLPNEIATRTRWATNPGHILVSNYSMIERLLIKPDQSSLFGNAWKFIILDEAHSYSGALGTEIAWLIRRLKRRVEGGGSEGGNIRYLATSATLIHSQETEEIKAQRIRDEFASKLFPAPANTFAVQFGHVQAPPAHEAATHATAENYLAFLPEGDTLLSETRELLGTKKTLQDLSKTLNLVPQAGESLAAGDAIHLLEQAYHVAGSGVLEVAAPDALNNDVLSPGSAAAVTGLKDLVVAGVGRFNDWNAWREWLHDPTDTRRSSISGDDDNGQRNRIGNRLHLRDEWQAVDQAACVLSREGFEYLVRTASELSIMADMNADPLAVQVQLSEAARGYLENLRDVVQTALSQCEQDIGAMAKQWRERFAENGFQTSPDDTTIHQVFFRALNADSKPMVLIHHLAQAIREFAPENQERMKLQSTADAVFPNEADAADALCNLINLGTLAVATGSRTPLVDIRYHQLVRGIGEIRIKLTPNGQNADFSLSKGFHEPGLGFGCCRECGQPFALGYSSSRQLAGQNVAVLTPYKGSTNQFLHAFAWSPGNELEDQEDDPMAPNASQWLDTANGRWQSGQANPGNDWVSVHWHVEAANDDSPEFLAECPCCRSKQQNTNNTRFGIITPYEMAGTQLKLVAMEELERHADRSADPVARANAGEGRKLLVFSDSRSAAAQLAWRFQDFFGQMTVPRLIRNGLEAFAANPWDPRLKQRLKEAMLAENPNFLNLPAMLDQFLDGIYNPQRPSPELPTAAISLACEFENENLGGLLAVASQNGADGADLTEQDAACFQLLRYLRRNNRHGLLRKGVLRVHPKNHADWTANALGLPAGVNVQPIMEWVMVFLIERVKLANLGNLPEEDLNRFERPLYQNNNPAPANAAEGTPFVSNHRGSHTNRFMRRVLLKHPAIWEAGMRQALQNLAGANAVLGTAAAGLPLENLSELAKMAESGTQADFRARIAQLVQPPGNMGARDEVRNRMRAHLVNLAGNLLGQIWPLLTNDQNGHAPLSNDNNLYSLNWKNLLILPGENFEPNYPEWAAEDRQINDREIIPCRVEEHTAQISSARGSAYQQAFANGRINILSCSTTFEMGVDLGDLGCVFLNGLPPAMANYRQRAGRAGRRPGSSAYVLTFLGDHPHDLYFWDRPAELLFGGMDAPKIYLDNPIYRARHLRAEALHRFLSWFEQNNAAVPTINPQNANQPGQPFQRRWKFVGDFFLGVTAGRRTPGNARQNAGEYPLTRRFTPVAGEISQWVRADAQALANYVKEISNIGRIDYCVAKDFLWQVASQAAGNLASPYPLEAANHASFQLLGGPNMPSMQENALVLEPETQPKRREVQVLARSYYAMGRAPDQFTHIEAVQNHVLKEQVIDWLAKNRVLPRYGFPVDVIRLLPDNADSYGRDTKLERDLKIGLYEYAPGQSVVADKRIYKTVDEAERGVKVFRQGQLAAARTDDAWKRWYCNACKEVFINIPHDQNPAPPCPLCNQNAMVLRQFVVPDAFQAKRSQAFSGVRPERPTPQHLLTGGAREPWRCAGISMDCAESESGTITYLNMGPRNQGFGLAGGAFSLLHEVRTDIALWRAHQNALGVFQGDRRESALRSALQAILRAAARVKNIEDRDLAGLVHHFNGNEAAFVLFDDSSGGGGACLDLVLTGNPETDALRAETIRQILVEARNICECTTCEEAFPNTNANLRPLPLDDFRALPAANQAQHRIQQSCYHCLRSYRNQRDHKHLDRLDAKRTLEAILTPPADPGGNAPVTQPQPVPIIPPPDSVTPVRDLPAEDPFILSACPGRVGGPFQFARVPGDDPLTPGSYLVRLEHGDHVLGRVNTNALPMMLSYQYNGDHHLQITRQQIIAQLR
jgi:hypothetical protein